MLTDLAAQETKKRLLSDDDKRRTKVSNRPEQMA